jgi:iron(III) transport system substrate-binding protein
VTPSRLRRRPAGARPGWAVRTVPALPTLLLALLLVACGADAPSPGSGAGTASGGGTVRLYTSYSQPEVDALLEAFAAQEPDVEVEVFRAPTGQLNARVAAEARSGGVQGDVLLLSDPVSMQQYADQGMLRRWTPAEESVVPPDARTDTFWGVTTSNVVVVTRPGGAPATWQELTQPRFRDAVALPDPGFAGSAFGALGYFALADGFGFDFYRALKDNGAVQVQSPGDVVTGVAEGRYAAGMTLDFVARAAIAKGSPLEISAPEPGAVRLYAPVAVFAATDDPQAAETFADFLLGVPAQQVLAENDRTPVRADVDRPSEPVPEVVPDWPAIFERQGDLLAGYRAVFGG